MRNRFAVALAWGAAVPLAPSAHAQSRVRARDLGVAPGIFSTRRLRTTSELANDDMSALFQGVVEATEEAIYNSVFMATSVTQRGRTVEAIPLDRVREILARYNAGRR